MAGSETGTEGETTANTGVNGSRARLPYGLDRSRVPVLGSWRSGVQQPAALRSAWYRLPQRTEDDGPTAAGGFGRRPLRPERGPGAVGHRTAGRREPGRRRSRRSSTSARHRPGEICGHRWTRSRETPPRSGSSRPTTTSRPSTGLRSLRRASRRCARCKTSSARPDPVLLDWLVGLAFPCQRPFGHRDGVDRGAEVADPAGPISAPTPTHR